MTKLEANKRSPKDSDQHRETCRRNGRVLQVRLNTIIMYIYMYIHATVSMQKMSNRLTAINRINWEETAKKKARSVLEQKDYHSSEYTCSETDQTDEENEGTTSSVRPKKIAIYPLPWERSLLTKVKKDLDDFYYKGLSNRAKSMLIDKCRVKEPSTRKPPNTGIDYKWAVRLQKK